MPDAYDAIVVGAGPAGSTTATLLAARGQRVMLADRARFPRPKPCAEYISPGAVSILRRLGAFEHLDLDHCARWLDGMRVVAPNGHSHLLTYRGPDGGAHAALAVPRAVLDTALLEVARRAGADLRERYRITALLRDQRGAVRGVVGPAGERVSAQLVVGADGPYSIVARAARVRRARRWPRRLGLTMHLADVPWPAAHGDMWVGRHGYAGVAPLDHAGLVSVGVVTTMPRAGALGDPRQALWRVIQEFPQLARRLAAGTPVGPPRGMGPLATRVHPCSGAGFALVGDAAGFFDPFTGEGIFRALRCAELLAASGSAGYAIERARAFRPKERLTALIQVFVQVPALMDLAIERLRQRPAAAQRLANMLGDLEPACLEVAWQLLAP